MLRPEKLLYYLCRIGRNIHRPFFLVQVISLVQINYGHDLLSYESIGPLWKLSILLLSQRYGIHPAEFQPFAKLHLLTGFNP